MNTRSRSSTGIFFSAAYALQSHGGGVQRCTHEYAEALETAGIHLERVVYAIDRTPLTRFRRRFIPRPYANLVDPLSVQELKLRVAASAPAWIFFNQIEAAQIVAEVAHLRSSTTRFALLSHGVDSTDYLHTARVFGLPRRVSTRWLGQQLTAEREMHSHFDVIFCLSETDRLFHQWLGGTIVHAIPRIVQSEPIVWSPVPNRVGTVSTLDHAPNHEGLVLLAKALARRKSRVRVRLIGRPQDIGHRLAREHSSIEYLGGLTDEQMTAEARTWSAFVNPIFCYARGCSTKLAVPLSWNIPVATTRAGARGYRWDESLVSLVDSPEHLVDLIEQLAQPGASRVAISALAHQSPTLAEVAQLFRSALAATASRQPS